ncbi:ribonuclease III [Loigolactobacillus backii]|uniref:Ribonuclease 3 n=1 Tax=Loigolactobacillus backii TaxID=375175 RepID=A0A192H4Y4_9LACO|nr:ribonuclease III [Loigolactobacillus backii]ANK59385.1 ribonuclease III [Loigolactobacillus backii]ANK63036.1 ribonuclease III [Loigolactobacillus backii]ANK64378.1 ribonuclease III [Loigolactobacillus backii]ANK67226.1 ribonuclease III [Loigolactobacillus backii]ANK69956.1 ribonuclease III [Loigolactobacillus backii]
MNEKFLKELKAKFGIEYHNLALLEEAFTQSSYVNEHPELQLQDYQRIEFLGDAVMELTVSDYLYKKYPNYPEGKLTRLRAAIVCEDSFSAFARECHFDQYILLGRGEEKNGARNRNSLLCDIFESFVGSLYLDQGKAAVTKFVQQVVFPKVEAGAFSYVMDHKTNLQEYLQKDGEVEISYHLVAEAMPTNNQQFTVEVVAKSKVLGTGSGHTKKAAEQVAAEVALDRLLGHA